MTFLLLVISMAVASAGGQSDDATSIDLISPNYLSVFEVYDGNFRLEDGRHFVSNTVRTECSANVWNHSIPNPNSSLSWQITTFGKMGFEYGSLYLRVRLPTDGVTSINIGLFSTSCTRSDCSKFNKMSSSLTFFLANNVQQQFAVWIYYPDRHSNMSSQLYTKNSDSYKMEQPQAGQDGFHIVQVEWSERLLAWKVDGIVVNFTNQLSLPVGSHGLSMDVFCANESARLPSQEAAFLTAQAEYRKPLGVLEKWTPDIQTKVVPPNTLNDYWSSQEAIVYLHSYDNEVAIYFDHIRRVPTMENDIYTLEDTWVYLYIKDVWAYLWRQYALVHQRGQSILYAVFRGGNSHRCYTSLQRAPSDDRRSILVCESNDPMAWSMDKRNVRAKFDIGYALSYSVVWDSEGIQGNQNLPSVNEALQDIVVYDLFLALNQTIQTGQLVSQRSNLSGTFPSGGSYWLRDWFFPLYHKYDAAQVLSRYFKVLAQNYPTVADDNGIIRYTRKTP